VYLTMSYTPEIIPHFVELLLKDSKTLNASDLIYQLVFLLSCKIIFNFFHMDFHVGVLSPIISWPWWINK